VPVVPAQAPASLSLADLEAFDPHPAGAGRERRFCCPLDGCWDKPRDRAHQSLSVNVESGLWTCYRCGAGGKLTEHRTPRPWVPPSQRRRTAALQAFRVPPPPQPGRAASAPELGPMLEACAPVAATPGEPYLFGRGIGCDTATAAGVLFARDWYGRPAVVFPLRDREGREVAASGRYLDRRQPKTRVAGDRQLGAFATPGAWERTVEGVGQPGALVLVEGPCDALALAECDVPAVALVGTAAPAWLRAAAAFRRVVVALDADGAGDAASAVLLRELAPFARSVERVRPSAESAGVGGKDWNDALLADYAGLCDALAGRGLLVPPDALPALPVPSAESGASVSAGA
jgi:Toprim-like